MSVSGRCLVKCASRGLCNPLLAQLFNIYIYTYIWPAASVIRESDISLPESDVHGVQIKLDRSTLIDECMVTLGLPLQLDPAQRLPSTPEYAPFTNAVPQLVRLSHR